MKVRHFNLTKDGALMDKDGEFVHINDLMLLLQEEKNRLERTYKPEKEVKDEWDKKYQYGKEEKVHLLEELIEKIRKGE